ncbi:MAG: hypothetical protein ACK4K0_03395 [Flavobacteriales bacterium]
MKQLILSLSILATAYAAKAQQPILSLNVELMEENIYENDFGPNRKRYNHYYLGFGVTYDIYEPDLADNIVMGLPNRSFMFSSGYTAKLKLSRVFALGFDYSLNAKNISVTQVGQINQLNDASTFNREKFSFFNLGLAPWMRINFDKKRGDILGKHVDLGGYANWHFAHRHRLKHKSGHWTGRSNNTQTNYKPDYVNNYEYGAIFKIGLGKFILYNQFRLSKQLNINGIDLPRFTSGVILGF